MEASHREMSLVSNVEHDVEEPIVLTVGEQAECSGEGTADNTSSTYVAPNTLSHINYEDHRVKGLLDSFLEDEELWRKYQNCLLIHVWALHAVDKDTQRNYLCTKNRYSLTVSTTSTHSASPEILTPQTDGGERFDERWIIMISRELKNIRFELLEYGLFVATSLGQGVQQVPEVGKSVRRVCNLTTSRLFGNQIETTVGGRIGLTLETVDIVKGLRKIRNYSAAPSDTITL